ncbi:UNVERIFIED_CONTAM: hypothetical protein Slati_2220700 [Sesamum latifolium]|uniref:DUF4283 domain-containing protein n=1 Tax=Sesamum latifolium TaxID=2727402 RepID=A0AAW2WU34_9LAMI
MMLRKLQHTQVPVWIKLRHLPVELWTTEGLSTVDSGIGKPLYPDAITRACTRLDFARVCVMLDICLKLPKHIVIMVPSEDGSESACKVDVEYEWLPPKCNACMTLGHSTKECPPKKPRQPPVSVYVQKPVVGPRESVTAPPTQTPWEQGRREERPVASGTRSVECEKTAVWNVRGLNHKDHQVSVTNLASEHRLHFMGLLKTRVSVGNVARVQRGLLPRWNCAQFVHCDVYIRYLHVNVFITIAYGVNDVVGQRLLWAELGRISRTVCDVPWLVGGDFNTVVDESEVCGQSRDIRGAAEEFQECLRDTGLITLPMQGSGFPGAWPNTFYVSLNARTSDHSPFVLRGDDAGQKVSMFRFDNYLTLSSEFIPRAQRQKKGDLSTNVKLAGTFLDSAQALLAQDRQCPVLLHLEFCCKMILRLATRLEQNMLHQRAKIAWMKGGDQCSRIFFRKVAKRRASKWVFQITDSGGQVLTEQRDVSNEFIGYYQTLLGGERRNRVIDLCYLRPWARHILSEAEAHTLVQPVTPGDIKLAVFDIDEVKAPGPDGFSSGFFKAA